MVNQNTLKYISFYETSSRRLVTFILTACIIFLNLVKGNDSINDNFSFNNFENESTFDLFDHYSNNEESSFIENNIITKLDLINSKNRNLGLSTPLDMDAIFSAYSYGSANSLEVLNKGKRIYVTNQLNEYNVDTNSNVNINLSNLNSQIGTDLYRVVSMFYQKKSISDGDDYFVKYILSPNIIYSFTYQTKDPEKKKYDDFKANCNYTSSDISYNIHTISNTKGKKFYKLRVINFVLDEERKGVFVATYFNGTFTYVDFDRYIDLENVSSSYINSESVKNQTSNNNANISNNSNNNNNSTINSGNNSTSSISNSTGNSNSTSNTTSNRYLQTNSTKNSTNNTETEEKVTIPQYEKISKNYINLNSIPRTSGISFDDIFIFDHPYDKYTYIAIYRKRESALLIYELITDSKGGLVTALFYAEIYLKLYLTEPITQLVTNHEKEMETIMKFNLRTSNTGSSSSSIPSPVATPVPNPQNNQTINNSNTTSSNTTINSNSTSTNRILQNATNNNSTSDSSDSTKIFDNTNGYDITQLGISKGNMIIGTDQGLFILAQTNDKTPNSFKLIRSLTRVEYNSDKKVYNMKVLNFVVGNYYMYVLVKYFGIIQLELSTMGISNKFQYFHPYVKQMDFIINPITFTKYLGVSFQNTEEMNDLLFEINIDDEEKPTMNKVYTKSEPIDSKNFVTNDFFYTYLFDKNTKKIFMLRRGMINNIPHAIHTIDISPVVGNIGEFDMISVFNHSSDVNELSFVVENYMIFLNRLIFPPDRMVCKFTEPGYYNVTLEKFSEACEDSISFNYAYSYCQTLIYINFNVIGKSFSNVAIAFTVIGIIALIALVILLIILYIKNQYNNSKAKKKEPTREELYLDKFADIDRKEVIIKEEDEEKYKDQIEKEKQQIEHSNRIVINNVLKGNMLKKNLDDDL